MLRNFRAGLGFLGLLAACASPPEPAQVPVTEDPEPAEVAAQPESSAPAANTTNPGASGGAPNAPSDETESDGPSASSSSAEAAPAPASPAASSTEPAKPPGLTVAETRTIEVIREIILKNRQRFRSCFDADSRKHPGQKGTLTLHFKLDPKGKVSLAEVNLARTTLKSPELASCAITALRGLPFPVSSRGFESEVNYPFDFR